MLDLFSGFLLSFFKIKLFVDSNALILQSKCGLGPHMKSLFAKTDFKIHVFYVIVFLLCFTVLVS